MSRMQTSPASPPAYHRGQPSLEEIKVSDYGPQIDSDSHAERLAIRYVEGGLAPKGIGVKEATARILAGSEWGMRPMDALHGICIINGRPFPFGKSFLGILQRSPLYEDGAWWVEGDGANMVAHCTFKRRGVATECHETFSWADAAKAGLDRKDTYRQWGKDMLQWRVIHRASRLFSDVLGGAIPAEVAIDDITVAENPQPIRRPRAVQTQNNAAGAPSTTGAGTDSAPPHDSSPVAEPPTQAADFTPAESAAGEIISVAQLKRLHAIAGRSGLNATDIKVWLLAKYGLVTSKDIATNQYDEICRKIESGNLGDEPPEPGSNG